MSKPTPRSESGIQAALPRVPEWAREDAHIVRKYRFQDFTGALGFMTRVALLAGAMNHHPEWSNIRNKVVIGLSTHEAGGPSELDSVLAEKIGRFV